MSDSVRPHRRQPIRLPQPWDSSDKKTGVGCHFLLQCVKVKVRSLSRVWLPATPWTAAYQAPPSMGFSRQEYWSGLPWPSLTIGQCCSKTLKHTCSLFNFISDIKETKLKKNYFVHLFYYLWMFLKLEEKEDTFITALIAWQLLK